MIRKFGTQLNYPTTMKLNSNPITETFGVAEAFNRFFCAQLIYHEKEKCLLDSSDLENNELFFNLQ